MKSYKSLPGVPDELLDSAGNVRPVWREFMENFSGYSQEEISQRFARGDQYLRDTGVFYRQYGEDTSSERDWPLSHIPVLIDETEWNTITAGLIQRADLLEDIVADLYGENRLVSEGRIPASLIAQSEEWLRPMVGVQPRSGHFLNFIAFEIGRGPKGNWWVLGDRTQAPSGAGFALENRVATARVFSDIYRDSHVIRLAGFFRNFKESLQSIQSSPAERIAILTPGQLNDTYFEHAYIARYMGFLLLEGEDLSVENGHVMVRTVDGLKPISVLWRRLDASWADPLELNAESQLGTPGLVEAIRRGNLSMINALGSGVLEIRALLAFMPGICQALRGEPLALPNIATWWCGQEKEREYVIENADKMMIGPAHTTQLPFHVDETTIVGGQSPDLDRSALASLLERDGERLVGQEAVTLSTTPAYINGALTPRPMSMRVFLARTPSGWQVMPGGYARIGRSSDATAIAMQRGGSVADVWVKSDTPVSADTMMPSLKDHYIRNHLGTLPSRAADNLYWLGRYVERTEHIIRLIRAYHLRLAETSDPDSPITRHIDIHLKFYGVDVSKNIVKPLSLSIGSAIGAASQVRDRFSTDGWMALDDLRDTLEELKSGLNSGDESSRAMSMLLRKLNGFSGLVHENMYRFTGWRFLSIGRSLERAMTTASMLAHFAAAKAPDGALDAALEIGDSAMSHRRLFTVATHHQTVIDLLALNVMNPRSILFHLTDIKNETGYLPGASFQGQMSPLYRNLLQLHTHVSVSTPPKVNVGYLNDFRSKLIHLSELFSSTYLR